MVKEYIDQMSKENQEELDRLEKQMRNYLDELTYAQEWHENLQIKNNSQTNIFSPRNFDEDLEQSLENVKNKITRINQQIESTRELIETHMKKKMEYQTLLQEINACGSINESESTLVEEREQKNTTLQMESVEIDSSIVNDNLTPDGNNSPATNVSEKKDYIDDSKTGNIQSAHKYTDEEVKTLLNDIYKKCEISMALLGNKNRCKVELSNIKHMIRDFVEKYE